MEDNNREPTEVLLDGKKLKHFRMARDLTQGQLEIKSGVGQAHISMMETGRRTNAEIATVSRLAHALDVRISDLLAGGGTKQQKVAMRSILLSEEDIKDAVSRALGGQETLSDHAIERITRELWRKEAQYITPPSAQPNAE